MTDLHENPAPLQAEPASPSEVAGLNARTARRQRLLLGGIAAVASGVTRSARGPPFTPGPNTRSGTCVS